MLRRLGPVTYEIQKNARSLPKVVHTDKLKPCIEPPAPAIDTPAEGDTQRTPEQPTVDRPRRHTRPPLRYRDD